MTRWGYLRILSEAYPSTTHVSHPCPELYPFHRHSRREASGGPSRTDATGARRSSVSLISNTFCHPGSDPGSTFQSWKALFDQHETELHLRSFPKWRRRSRIRSGMTIFGRQGRAYPTQQPPIMLPPSLRRFLRRQEPTPLKSQRFQSQDQLRGHLFSQVSTERYERTIPHPQTPHILTPKTS